MELRIAVAIFCLLILAACQQNVIKPAKPAVTGSENQTTSAVDPEIPLGQLSNIAMPEHYAIDLTLITDADTLSGKVAITVKLNKSTNSIFLHGKGLRVKSVTVTASGQQQPADYKQVHASGVARVSWGKALAGEIQIEFIYQADYSNSLDSIYKVRESGRDYLFSQMEPISARMSFPSFDEPRFKTPFDIAVTAKAEDKVISNTPETGVQQLANGLVRHTFATTQPLPTYLLAFAVGPLDVVESAPLPPTAVRDRPVPLRGITAHGKGDKIRFALTNTRALFESLERYFGVPYPYAKLDLLAVPDYAFGAMENAGAIVFRESYMLLDDEAPLSQKINYGSVNAHEMSHQWFGDLVTPKWWDDIWLNEAFASWMQNKAAYDWRPDYEYDRAIARRKFAAMATDARSSARRIRQPIRSNDDIMNAFDSITYQKGSSVLQMFENLVGKDAFRKGIQLYLQRFAFKAANVHDFETALADGSGNQEIIPAFESFLNQSGAPYLDLSIQCQTGRSSVSVRQSRYVPLGVESNKAQQWIVPLCYTTDQGQDCQIIRQQRQSFALNYCPAYFMPNRDGAGYYRWGVSAEYWQKLMQNLAALDANEQFDLVNNLIAAFQTNKVTIETLLDMFRLSTASDNWDVITAPLGGLATIRHSLLDDKFTPGYRALVQSLYTKRFMELGYTPTTAADKRNAAATARLRQRLVTAMAREAQVPAVRGQLIDMIKSYLGKDNNSINRDAISPNLVAPALAVAVEDSDVDFARQLLERGLSSTDAIFRSDVLAAIARTRNIDFGKSIIDELLLSDRIRSNEAPLLIGRFMANPDYRQYTWAWLKNHFDAFIKRYSSFSAVGIVYLGGYFCDATARDDVQKFYRSVQDQVPGAPRAIAENVESINQCIALKATYSDDWNKLMLSRK